MQPKILKQENERLIYKILLHEKLFIFITKVENSNLTPIKSGKTSAEQVKESTNG